MNLLRKIKGLAFFAVIDTKYCTIEVRGGGVGQKITIKLGEGTLTYDEKRNMEYRKDRGILDTVREGDEEPMDVRLDSEWEWITGDGDITAEDAMKRRGDAAAWTSSDADECAPYAVDLMVFYAPPCVADGETITLPDFRYETISHDLKAGTISFSGKCNAKEASSVRGVPTT